ncbi:MAG: DUF4149 domain-containing protein [Ignavibacteriae bacterium]|nr:DUF4149 domain-containing protein [Ignavibacteriota bacterium]
MKQLTEFRTLFMANRMLTGSMLLFYLGIALWLGGLIFFGFGVASTLFSTLPSRDIAGTVNRIILSRLTILEYVGGCFIIGALLLHNRQEKGFVWKLPFIIIGVMVTLLVVYSLIIGSQMNSLVLSISSFDHPHPKDQDSIAGFTSLHHLYSSLVKLNLGLGFILFIWQTLLYSLPNGKKSE